MSSLDEILLTSTNDVLDTKIITKELMAVRDMMVRYFLASDKYICERDDVSAHYDMLTQMIDSFSAVL